MYWRAVHLFHEMQFNSTTGGEYLFNPDSRIIRTAVSRKGTRSQRIRINDLQWLVSKLVQTTGYMGLGVL